MLEDLSADLDAALQETRERERLRKSRRAIVKQIDTESDRVMELAKQFESERADVIKLEGLGLTQMFYTLLGSKEQRLEQEKQELLAVKLKYDEHAAVLASLREQLASIRDRMDELGDVEARVSSALDAKQEAIVASGHAAAEELVELARSKSELGADHAEIRQALTAGRHVMTGLEKIDESLVSAQNWGAFDLVAGGAVSSMAKYSKIDEAKQALVRLQADLLRLQRELADVRVDADIEINVDGFTKFADVFLDGLISDWVAQRRIKDSRTQVSAATNKIGRLMRWLQKEESELGEQLEEVTRKRRALIGDAD